MDLDDQLRRYFGSADLMALPVAALEAGLDRARVDFGLEKDPARRFALWTFLYMLDAAPDLDVAFKSDGERDAARTFMDMVDKAGEG
ncbi:hypothetical protein KFK14_21655 [Sphingobium phenoxybenzoativorans]|uniref:Uncharacterized protein n=1 Tax=Sphingobium phenoxybenzoativorans TaxID=1592790 RepID=A0A975K672_9SPHN|nr:hypothetical protein [Sphingobium phenoxybenzoativorans]QUT05534.1 hypothetical protein KFK14_21655 [Sphingobium phenoxybenzoativorans]